MRLEILSALNRERAARRIMMLVTDLENNEQRLVVGGDAEKDEVARLGVERLQDGQDGVIALDGRSYFLSVIRPPPRLVVIGAVHVAQALTTMARPAGFESIVIDPRSAFATAERFPNVRLYAEWPDLVLANIGLDRYTAVACLTHDPKIDDVALTTALRTGCGYVGALGSARTHARRLDRLAKSGLDQDALKRIHAPIGLDIGATSPAEIAVSILAEIMLLWRHKPLRSDRIAAHLE